MMTCTDCGNPFVGGHPIEHNGPPRTITYEYECGRCGRWWLEHVPIPADYRPNRLPLTKWTEGGKGQ